MALIGTNEAARRLKLSMARLTAMIRSKLIAAQKIGNSWVVDEAEVERVRKLSRPAGRPKKKKQ